ncbi:hypothetical protein [Pontibacter ruber]|uniref:Uncharacterized protein n=1 Tax=Pontibacter ruber TaxID=1343895 RepID=A0ABW5D1D4_9BACT|nr:hypothetical protein [Pontibacter ruber]
MIKGLSSSTILILLVGIIAYGQDKYLDPTGSYILRGKKLKEGEKGSYGELHVKLISKDRLAISFYYDKGYPSYNSGSFVDTLEYNYNRAVYIYNEAFDPSDCKLTFTFEKKAVVIKHEASNYNYSCGFGTGVIANTVMKKSSSKVPVIKDYWEN